jgi:hypothetical protein
MAKRFHFRHSAAKRMDVTQQLNLHVLNHLTREGEYMCRKNPGAPVFAPWDSMPDPYRLCGCHPEIVGRLWDQIGPVLPEDCRGLVHSNPALVHPKSGVILAVGLGSWYGLRLPGLFVSEAIEAGAKTCTKFSTGEMDIRRSLGHDWVFGGFCPSELTWSKRAFEFFTPPVGCEKSKL